ncbi:MAG: hypothetical protein P4L43_11785 [Syntrophobacteraceae bacterium]|nr:hypothetical protein [Syntrophobacteraceae bacterium]
MDEKAALNLPEKIQNMLNGSFAPAPIASSALRSHRWALAKRSSNLKRRKSMQTLWELFTGECFATSATPRWGWLTPAD